LDRGSVSCLDPEPCCGNIDIRKYLQIRLQTVQNTTPALTSRTNGKT
jgi:hypothetical protein